MKTTNQVKEMGPTIKRLMAEIKTNTHILYERDLDYIELSLKQAYAEGIMNTAKIYE